MQIVTQIKVILENTRDVQTLRCFDTTSWASAMVSDL